MSGARATGGELRERLLALADQQRIGYADAALLREAAAALSTAIAPAGEREAGPLPETLWDVSAEWYTLCERAPHATKISITGELAEAIVKTVCLAAPQDGEAERLRGMYRNACTELSFANQRVLAMRDNIRALQLAWRDRTIGGYMTGDPVIDARTEADSGAYLNCADALTPMAQGGGLPTYQDRVGAWMDECFPKALYGDMTQRCDRFLEESLELLQSLGYDRTRVATLVDYVWSRPIGEPRQEVGGTVVTLAALCWVAGIDMHAEAWRELERIEQPEVMAKIRAKQEAKNALHFDSPLPGPDVRSSDWEANGDAYVGDKGEGSEQDGFALRTPEVVLAPASPTPTFIGKLATMSGAATIEGPKLPDLRWVRRSFAGGADVLQQAVQMQRGAERWVEWRALPIVAPDEDFDR